MLIPLQVPILLVNNMINSFVTRTELIYFQRRTVSRSQSILVRKNHLLFIYYLSIVLNSWQSMMTIGLVEEQNPQWVDTFLTTIDPQTIFFLKLVLMVILAIFALSAGEMANMIVKGFMNIWIDSNSYLIQKGVKLSSTNIGPKDTQGKQNSLKWSPLLSPKLFSDLSIQRRWFTRELVRVSLKTTICFQSTKYNKFDNPIRILLIVQPEIVPDIHVFKTILFDIKCYL